MGLSKNDVTPSGGGHNQEGRKFKNQHAFFGGGGVIRLTDKKVGN
jgi:hypothetical protein